MLVMISLIKPGGFVKLLDHNIIICVVFSEQFVYTLLCASVLS